MGYEIRRQLDRPGRIPSSELPWQVYSNEPHFQPAVVHALNSWNEMGRRNGMGLIYELANSPQTADLVIDWSGSGLPPNRASAVWWQVKFGSLQVTGLSMDGRMQVPMGNFSQLLMHELGHPLGLDHSVDRQDIMFETMHTRRYTQVDQAAFSERDFQAFRALYSINDFIPITGRRGRASAKPSLTPKPSDPSKTPLEPVLHNSQPQILQLFSWREKDGSFRYWVGPAGQEVGLGVGRTRAEFQEFLQNLPSQSRLNWKLPGEPRKSELRGSITKPKPGESASRTFARPVGEEMEDIRAICSGKDILLKIEP